MNLKVARVIRNLNQYDLAQKTGIFQSVISQIELGYRIPTVEERRKISKALRISQKEIFVKAITK